ncbi:MAG: hypothetical protein E7634_00630 [Ruminococcaceae bacterium]|nr:hypothetical protein [Oscillospiraceae bacterium]MBQ9692788.1 hypothetical protein [Clostridia bacterium]
MAKESITVSIADINVNLKTSSSEEVRRMAAALDAEVRKNMQHVGGRVDIALIMTVMMQAENLKKNAELIHSQQDQIFALTNKNSALLGEAPESAPIEKTENAIMMENHRLQQKIEELSDEIYRLRTMLYSAPEEK